LYIAIASPLLVSLRDLDMRSEAASPRSGGESDDNSDDDREDALRYSPGFGTEADGAILQMLDKPGADDLDGEGDEEQSEAPATRTRRGMPVGVTPWYCLVVDGGFSLLCQGNDRRKTRQQCHKSAHARPGRDYISMAWHVLPCCRGCICK
jgi:hypothetical protein